MYKFVVHRPNWARGQDGGSLLRYDDDNTPQRCCLGFLAHQVGRVPNSELEGIELPSHVPELGGHGIVAQLLRPPSEDRHHGSSEFMPIPMSQQILIANTNDDSCIGDERREEDLTRFFEAIDIAVEFTDEPEPT